MSFSFSWCFIWTWPTSSHSEQRSESVQNRWYCPNLLGEKVGYACYKKNLWGFLLQKYLYNFIHSIAPDNHFLGNSISVSWRIASLSARKRLRDVPKKWLSGAKASLRQF